MNEHKKNIDEVKRIISSFHQQTSAKQRYASFDFCFLYYQTHRHSLSRNMELSCLHLWSYLASWGMLRGSSKLLQECSMKSLSGIIEYLSELNDADWELDLGLNAVGERDDAKSQRIIDIYKDLVKKIKEIQINDLSICKNVSSTLVSKIMLGTLGCVPALDQFFSNAFREEFKTDNNCGFRSLTKEALLNIQTFYTDNKEIFDSIQYKVVEFNNESSNLLYPKAKLIDMYGFSIGFTNAQELKKTNKGSKPKSPK